MYKIKLFSAEKTALLQALVNEWLLANKEIVIHSSNMAGSNGDHLGANEYNFYILYSGPLEQAAELVEIATAAVQDQSVEVKEMNPEILKPSS